MQLWFLCFCVYFLALPKVVRKNLFHYFWKPRSPFSMFCVNCLLRFYFVYCVGFVLNDVNADGWHTCSLVALNVPENWFWPAKTRKNWNFLRCIPVFDLVLKNCSDINEGKWLQVLFHFFVLMGKVSWDIGVSFFLLCFRFLIEVFSFCTFTETFAIGFQNWFDNKWIDFEVFHCNMAFFVDFFSVWTEICNNYWNLFPFWRDRILSEVSLTEILVCSLKMLVVFWPLDFVVSIDKLYQCNETLISMFLRLPV